MTKRIRLSRARGWRLPEGAITVARPTKWGNPFIVGQHGTRAQCAAMFLTLQQGFLDLGGPVSVEDQLASHRHVRRNLSRLAGRDLACWCPLDDGACHADVLLLLANPGLPVPLWLQSGVELRSTRIGMDVADFEKLERTNRLKNAAEAAYG